MTASGTRSLVFIDHVTADICSRMNPKVYRPILSGDWTAFHNTNG